MKVKCPKITMLFFLFSAFGVSSASADFSLFDWVFNVDGTIYENFNGDTMPTAGTLDSEGLGTLTWSTSDVGYHSFIAFFDHEFCETDNTFFNEYGAVVGTPGAGQSWEIDEPGFVYGDIYWNVLDGILDNSNDVPSGLDDDVSMAMGWDFTLEADQSATIELILNEMMPADLSMFYLSHTDPDSEETIYFSSTLTIEGGGPVAPIPEPATVLLMATGLAGLFGLRRRKFLITL